MRPAAAAILVLLAGCSDGEPTIIDGSSAEAFKRTSREARDDIPDRDRIVYDRALRTVGGRRHAADPDELARVTFNGMTAEQVVADQRARETKGS